MNSRTFSDEPIFTGKKWKFRHSFLILFFIKFPAQRATCGEPGCFLLGVVEAEGETFFFFFFFSLVLLYYHREDSSSHTGLASAAAFTAFAAFILVIIKLPSGLAGIIKKKVFPSVFFLSLFSRRSSLFVILWEKIQSSPQLSVVWKLVKKPRPINFRPAGRQEKKVVKKVAHSVILPLVIREFEAQKLWSTGKEFWRSLFPSDWNTSKNAPKISS